jgi:response regulator NasT
MGNRGVCLAAANRPFLSKLSQILLGHTIPVLGMAQTDDTAVRLCRSLYPDALITHQFLLSGSGFVAANALLGQTPTIVLCPRGEADFPASEEIKTLYLPVNVSELLTAVSKLGELGRRQRIARHELNLIEQRDVVDKAKARLMQKNQWSEPQAHAHLQRTAMAERIKLYEAAQRIMACGVGERRQD